ncbi:MAG TPA: hypothetical protein VN520_36730 [Streptomyces sp.]|uniref:hypothetical protein n=1 Tax=Streptomyces sp. TaxID=1931 RepID=UPI002B780D7E|nr:hypothetical protein [Streptomyces sp.]HWU11837.1 hypothetical protein [Streptomyces sp.]
MTRFSLTQDGLDLSNPDATTREEIAAFHAEYERTKKGRLDSFEFWIEFRPDVLKRHKARSRHFFGEEAARFQVPIQMLAIHQYAVEGFQAGIGYEIRLARSNGAQRSDILDALSVANIHSGHQGMYAAYAEAPTLRAYVDPPLTERFPPGWDFDPHAFDAGMDHSSLEATKADIDALMDWYTTTLGEIPRYARLLARHRPGLLKAYRNRYEHAIRDSLPKQMLPYLLLNHSTVKGDEDAIRENVLLGRALGMTTEQLLDSIGLAVLFAGIEVLGPVERSAGDVLGL